MLRLLRELLESRGRLTCALIEGAADLPCSMTYIVRFGSLRRAYELIGYHPDTFRVFTIQDARRSGHGRDWETISSPPFKTRSGLLHSTLFQAG
jgi:hypothetical protein